jgi:hypothetical protein
MFIEKKSGVIIINVILFGTGPRAATAWLLDISISRP